MIRAALTLGLVCAAPAAMACSPALSEGPFGEMLAGESCRVVVNITPLDGAAIGEVVDLGNGLVGQMLINGDGCYPELNIVVQDCAAGRGQVIGTQRIDPFQRRERGLTEILGEFADGGFATMAAMVAHADRDGFGASRSFALPGPVQVEGQSFDLSCGCATLYPEANAE